MSYEIASTSYKGRKKDDREKNGDYCRTYENDQCVVLALADGVGSCADDFRASHTLCDRFIAKCTDALSKNVRLDEKQLRCFCDAIDSVLSVDNDMACFCAVVWYKSEDQCTYLHTGDTRIYKHSNHVDLLQVTEDDHSEAVNVKIGGELYTVNGALVSFYPINKAIGDGSLEYHTGTFTFVEGESIILCSDGMYNSSTFKNDLKDLINKASIAEAIHAFTTTDDDDATLLILRRDITSGVNASLRDIMLHFDHFQKQIPLSDLIDKFADDLQQMLQNGSNIAELMSVVQFMRTHSLYPDKKRMGELFDTAYNIYKPMAEGEYKQRFNEVCCELREMQRFVFRKKF